MIVLAFLMVSTFRYWSFKKVDLRRRRSYVEHPGHRALLPARGHAPGVVLLGMATLFWLSGPAYTPLEHRPAVASSRRRPVAATGTP